MGFWGTAAQRIRSLLQWDKERIVLQLAKGGTAGSLPETGFDLLQAYGYDVLSDYLKLEQDLMARYSDYESMSEMPEISSALDIYADDAVQHDSLQNRSVWVDSEDQTIKEIITDLFDKRIRIDEELWSMCRNLATYGNAYEELLVTQDGLVGTNFLPTPTMRRIEGRRGELFGFVQDFRGRFSYSPDEFKQILAQRMAYGGDAQQSMDKMAAFEDWEVLHMRLRNVHRRSTYGHGIIDGARWIFKRIMLLEDAAMIYRLQRAPERFAFYVDVGDLPPKEAFAYVNKIRQQYKKNKYINPQSGKLDLRFNPLEQSEDFFVPVRKGVQSTKIEVLQSPMWSHVEDLEFFRQKLYAALKVPKSYLGYSESTAKGSLCVAGDTDIPLLDGRSVKIKDLCCEVASGKKTYVYSCDANGMVVPGEVVACQKTRANAEILEIELDDGSKFRTTPDHPFMMRDGSYMELKDLVPGDSLMPLYRKVSRGKGAQESLRGYEMVMHPSTDDYEYTHRMIARWKWGDRWWIGDGGKQMVCHHASFDKRNNHPDLLDLMGKLDHLLFHRDHCDKFLKRPDVIEKRMKGVMEWVSTDRCKEIARANLIAVKEDKNSKWWEWQRSQEHKNAKSKQMKRQWAEPGSKLLARTRTEEFKAEISDQIKEYWTRPEYRSARSGESNNRWRNDASLEKLAEVARSYRCRNLKDLVKWSGYSQCLIRRILKDAGITYAEFADKNLLGGYKLIRKGIRPSTNERYREPEIPGSKNHKVVSVRQIENEDCYDLTVLDHHNFAILGQFGSGIFIHNSQEDVRYSKSVLRLQRELRNGLAKMSRVHLAALNVNPAALDYEIYMTIPSSIFELAQLEVRNAKADFAARMSQFVSLHWILQKVFGLNDDEINFIIKERHEEAMADADVQAKAMGLQMQVQAQNQPQAPAAPAPGEEKIANATADAASQVISAEPGSGKAEEAQRRLRELAQISRMLSRSKVSGFRSISERELLSGNRDDEKRMEDAIGKMMEQNAGLSGRMNELGQLIKEISMAMPKRRE